MATQQQVAGHGGEIHSSRVASVFDLVSQNWQTKNRVISRIEGESERLLRLIGDYCDVENVLDIGAGAGKAALRVRECNPDAHLTLCDVSESMLARARAQLGNNGVDYVLADAARLPFPDAVFELVLIQQVLHHVDVPLCVLQEAARVTARGGTVLVLGPSSGYQANVFPWRDESIQTDLLGRLSEDSVSALASDAGLTVRKIHLDQFKFYFERFDDYFQFMHNIGAFNRPFGYSTEPSEQEKYDFLRSVCDAAGCETDVEIVIDGEYFTLVAEVVS